MRISDWSSDVCSSDLAHQLAQLADGEVLAVAFAPADLPAILSGVVAVAQRGVHLLVDLDELGSARDRQPDGLEDRGRSEEHTSELQSLMRISYAVFCLKKKNDTTQNTEQPNSKDRKSKHK